VIRAGVAAVCLAGALAGCGGGGDQDSALPPIGHVFTIVLENKDYDATFGADPPAPYLAETLPAEGELLTQYYGTGHASLGNYLTMISGQSESAATQADCRRFVKFERERTAPDDQAVGDGCVYPPRVVTLADQLEATAQSWGGYMESMGDDPARDGGTTCAHPPIGAPDRAQVATPSDQYATRHNPFVYFRSIIDDEVGCRDHVVKLAELTDDLRDPESTPKYTFIVPDLCSDGHDERCPERGRAGGYAGIDEFLRFWVPRITASPAFREDGLLFITFDESESDSEACCFTPDGPNVEQQGVGGPGGGRTGAVLISPFIEPGTVNDDPYNHYDYLHTMEDIFDVPYLGYAGNDDVHGFGTGVFSG
jgi:hypothetical protein